MEDELGASDQITDRVEADGRRVLAIRGRLGTDQARPLWHTALRLAQAAATPAGSGEAQRGLIVDCRDLEHLGGAALQVLLALQVTLSHQGGQLRLLGASPGVTRTLALSGVTPELLPREV